MELRVNCLSYPTFPSAFELYSQGSTTWKGLVSLRLRLSFLKVKMKASLKASLTSILITLSS